jgi:acetyl-CoA carboxylase carboxyltransferase component
MGPDFIFGWPTVEFAPTGPEMMVHAVFNKELAQAKEDGNYDELFERYVGILREMFSVMTMGKVFTQWYTVHEVIDPRESRPRIIRAIRDSLDKHEEMPDKRRYIKPA